MCTVLLNTEWKTNLIFWQEKNTGTIGVDFNKGFLTVSEIDKNGNLLNTKKLYYRFGQGSKTKSDLEKIILYIVRKCIETGKDLCIENLNFKNTKADISKGFSKIGKKYNNMLHSLAYSLFDKLVTNIAFRNKVDVKKVNPAWTSWIAENKFCDRMKLNIHNGAAFVIARRGLGIKENVK